MSADEQQSIERMRQAGYEHGRRYEQAVFERVFGIPLYKIGPHKLRYQLHATASRSIAVNVARKILLARRKAVSGDGHPER